MRSVFGVLAAAAAAAAAVAVASLPVAGVTIGRTDLEAGTVTFVPGDVPWEMVTSFCFDTSGQGRLEWSVELGDAPVNANQSLPSGYEILLYDDQPESFPRLWANRDKVGCPELKQYAKNVNEPIWIPRNATVQNVYFTDVKSSHQWFVAISACNAPGADKERSVTWRFTFENEDGKASAELTALPGPTVVALILTILTFGGTALSLWAAWGRAKTPLDILLCPLKRLTLELCVCLLGAQVGAWLWDSLHAYGAIFIFVFFQGAAEALIMLAAANIFAVSGLAPGAQPTRWLFILHASFCGAAVLYWVAFFCMAFLGDFFPGVVGATMFANGFSNIAWLIRILMTVIWLVMSGMQHFLVSPMRIPMLAFVGFFAIYLFLVDVAAWSTEPFMFSCNPPSVLVTYWFIVLTDGLLGLFLVALTHPMAAALIGLPEAGAARANSLLDNFLFFKWWNLAGGATAPGDGALFSDAATDDGVGPAPAPGSAAHEYDEL